MVADPITNTELEPTQGFTDAVRLRLFQSMREFAMSTLNWSPALSIGVPLIDGHHRDFVACLDSVEAADDAALLEAWRQLIDMTAAHFAVEDRWMREAHFAHASPHALQHQMVLRVLRDVERGGSAGNLALLRQMARELATWFPLHLHGMDAAFARHLRSAGRRANSLDGGALARRPEPAHLTAQESP
jgi:hemerythrin-like metal-binding protein